MTEALQITDTDMSQPVDIEINTVGELVIVLKTIPTKFEQKYDPQKMTYTLEASWKP